MNINSPVQPRVAAAVSALLRAAVSAAPSCASAPSSPAPSPSSASSRPAGRPEADLIPGWGPPQRQRRQRGEEMVWRQVVVTSPPHLAPRKKKAAGQVGYR